MWKQVEECISKAINREFFTVQRRPVSGGCISEAHMLCDGKQCFFVKLNPIQEKPLLEAEALGLAELRKAEAFRVPNFVCVGETAGQAFLVLEFLQLRSVSFADEFDFAERLHKLHSFHGSHFGFHKDNFIGSSVQANGFDESWQQFWVEKRLKPQAERARHLNEELYQKILGVCAGIDHFFKGYEVKPSLLHGDLWAGNVAVVDNAISIFDPAVYYGDREADLAMTEMMGGFSHRFYEAYKSLAGIDEEGYLHRKRLYNLYHVLNHLNLFGASYYMEALSLTEHLLAEAGA